MEKIIPKFLKEKIKEQYNEEESKLILDGLIQNKKSSFRVNRIKSNVSEISKKLEENKIEFSRDEFLNDAFIIENEDESLVRKLDIYNNGKIYFQSLSSILPVIILNPQEKENILDMCSAPRWKNNSVLQV